MSNLEEVKGRKIIKGQFKTGVTINKRKIK